MRTQPAICLRPVDETTMATVMTTLVSAGRTVEEGEVEEGEPERPVIIVHEDCIRPTLHPDYSL
jgi:hypothetical protein